MKTVDKLLLLIISLISLSCNNDVQQSEKKNEINIRLKSDPQYVHPIYYPTSIGREISQYLYLPLADYHPETLKLHPILITDIPVGRDAEYLGEKVVEFDMQLRKEATWSDGTDITGHDYAFTVKAIAHPLSKMTAYKPYYAFVREVRVDPENPKKFTVIVDKDYMLSKEIAVTLFILPAHHHDPSQLLKKLDLKTLAVENYTAADTSEINMIKALNESPNDKLNIVQTGAYRLTAFENNQYYILEKIDNHWSTNYRNNPFLKGNIDKLIFKIVPDEITAVTMAKEGKIDLMMMRQSEVFLGLKEDETFSDKWTFHIPQLMRYYIIALNNKSEILSDKTVRRALAHLADVDDYIETVDGGLGTRTTGGFHPTKDYYNSTLPPIPYDVEQAKALLAEAGWIDSNGDKIVDKVLNGNRVQLDFDLLLTGSPLSKNIALLFQESASKAGVKVNLITKKSSLMRKENLYNFNYDMALLSSTQDAAPNDPYDRWHSDNAIPGKRNTVGYANAQVDELIDELRLTLNDAKRKELYMKIQELIYADSPAIFLYCPLNKIIISNNFKGSTTSKRPGYIASSFTVKK